MLNQVQHRQQHLIAGAGERLAARRQPFRRLAAAAAAAAFFRVHQSSAGDSAGCAERCDARLIAREAQHQTGPQNLQVCVCVSEFVWECVCV